MHTLRFLGSGARLLRGSVYGARGSGVAGAAGPCLRPPRAGPATGSGSWGFLPRTATAGARAMSTEILPEHRRITMPKLSPTMEVGTIAGWRKAEGDAIDENDVLAEIDTDKASMEYNYSDVGFLAKVGGRERSGVGEAGGGLVVWLGGCAVAWGLLWLGFLDVAFRMHVSAWPPAPAVCVGRCIGRPTHVRRVCHCPARTSCCLRWWCFPPSYTHVDVAPPPASVARGRLCCQRVPATSRSVS